MLPQNLSTFGPVNTGGVLEPLPMPARGYLSHTVSSTTYTGRTMLHLARRQALELNSTGRHLALARISNPAETYGLPLVLPPAEITETLHEMGQEHAESLSRATLLPPRCSEARITL